MKQTLIKAVARAGVSALALLLSSPVWCATSQTRTSGFEYDPNTGLLIKEVIEPEDSALCLVTSYTHDGFGNRTGATTRNCDGTAGEAPPPTGEVVIAPRTSTTGYDSQGRFATSASNALGHSETRAYDARFGTVTSLTGPNQLVTTWSYDGFGRKTVENRADDTRTEWAYLYCNGVNEGTHACPTYGRYLVQSTPRTAAGVQNGPITKVYFDALNREIRSETQGFDGTLVFKDTQYDSQGRVAQVSRPYYAGQTASWTVYAYDILGRVVSATEPATSAGTVKTETQYDGLTTTVTVSNNGTGTNLPEGVTQSKTILRNTQGQSATVTDALGNAVSYTYDPFGNLLETNAGGVVTTLEYDRRGRKTKMTDPDMGVWTYRYNALSELVWQCDPVSRALASTGNPADCTEAVATRMQYDKLGRLTKRTERDLTSEWFHDTEDGTVTGSACGLSTGKLCKAAASNGYERRYNYESKGRMAQLATTIEGAAYAIGYGYDPVTGQLQSTTYPATATDPAGLVVKNVFNERGYLQKVTDGAGTLQYWEATAVSAAGKVEGETLGNGLATVREYDALDRLTKNRFGVGTSTVRQFEYGYDTIGNLVERRDIVPHNLSESFTYDRLNRLTRVSNGNTAQDRSFTYSAIGNLASKSDVGTYTYLDAGNTRPHAVSGVSGAGAPNSLSATYGYDANGNLVSAAGTIYPAAGGPVAFSRTLTYMSFNMPQSVSYTQGANTYGYEYTYNADHERVKLVVTRAEGSFTTVYLHPAGKGQLLYEKESRQGSAQVDHKHFISAGAILVGVYITRDSPETGIPATEMRYFHADHLGSVVALTNAAGAALEQLSYESFGERRLPDGSAPDRVSPEIGVTTDRGFTGHEHLDEMNLIHMNGRIYDPALARFMTADPFIQSPENLQSYNRYSYVLNNPLAYTDPSGYFSFKKFFRAAVAIAAAVVLGPEVLSAYTAAVGNASVFGTLTAAGITLSPTGFVASGAIGGFAAGLIGGGDIESGLQGALVGALFGAVANIPAGTPASYLGHAGVGCLSGEMSGSGCARGAASAVVGKFATNQTGSLSSEARFVVATVAGGTASVIGGGKFENGAVTAAFGYLFNHCSSVPGGCLSAFKDAASMARDWALGVGPDTRVFGPGSIQVTDMMDAPGVNAARDLFYQKNAGGTLDPVTNYAARFGVIDYLTTTSPTQQFVGSYRVDVFAVDQGKSLMFVLNNTSSFRSFAYGVAPAWERSTFTPAGNMRQTYWWTEPRRP